MHYQIALGKGQCGLLRRPLNGRSAVVPSAMDFDQEIENHSPGLVRVNNALGTVTAMHFLGRFLHLPRHDLPSDHNSQVFHQRKHLSHLLAQEDGSSVTATLGAPLPDAVPPSLGKRSSFDPNG